MKILLNIQDYRMYSRKHSHYTINIYKILFTFDQQDIKSGNKICGNDDILPQHTIYS